MQICCSTIPKLLIERLVKGWLNIWSYMEQWKTSKCYTPKLLCLFVFNRSNSLLQTPALLMKLSQLPISLLWLFLTMHRQELNWRKLWHNTAISYVDDARFAILTCCKPLCCFKLQKLIHKESCRSLMTLKVMTGRHLHQPRNLCFFVDIKSDSNQWPLGYLQEASVSMDIFKAKFFS